MMRTVSEERFITNLFILFPSVSVLATSFWIPVESVTVVELVGIQLETKEFLCILPEIYAKSVRVLIMHELHKFSQGLPEVGVELPENKRNRC